ncbi:RNA-directed DNA polymerase, eukaryota [Tanacetum coccineum]
MESMDLLCVKQCWGNATFDYVHNDSVGYSGGILCVWDSNAFRMSSTTVSDYFVMDYLMLEISRWKGEVVVMGDFNEVRYSSDRYGSVFNVQGANAFNSFISNVGLVEVSLGGCSFTWCHKSAMKMSKLDRFLVSDSILNLFPHIYAITLERYLSDRWPILLREHHVDYGPIPFRFFHYWCEVDGFSELVEDVWKESPNNASNAMVSFMGKLKYLKVKIREWNKNNMASRKNVKDNYMADLEVVEGIIDNGKVHGIMVDGVLIDDPTLEKHEFLLHFSRRFAKPDATHAYIQSSYPNRLSLEQRNELESEVSNEEKI